MFSLMVRGFWSASEYNNKKCSRCKKQTFSGQIILALTHHQPIFTQVHFRLDFIMEAMTMNTYEQSDQGPYCLQYRPPKKISGRRADNKGKGLRQERKIHARIQRAGTGGLDPPPPPIK